MSLGRDFKAAKDIVNLVIYAAEAGRAEQFCQPLQRTLNSFAKILLENEPNLERVSTMAKDEGRDSFFVGQTIKLAAFFQAADTPAQPDLFDNTLSVQRPLFDPVTLPTSEFEVGNNKEARAAIDNLEQRLKARFPSDADRIARIAAQGRQAYAEDAPTGLVARLSVVLPRSLRR
ncbi:MAG: hypothetical protein DI551_00870 [Micavibrio aeruginosavorus]|uniref:Uncharacterized protein n=1 Tax=Micavibrio aeruginosavorus TaxID=349221 RepID=A0A2W5N7Z9_9BACT|nr:MAG: hypothetical protein DI551_00870 [Micavibrio aeruginosavorus]